MWNLKEFESIYSRYQSSGLRVKNFCCNECISLSCFFYWQKKLKQDRKELEHPSGFVPLVLNSTGSPGKCSSDYSPQLDSYPVERSICELIYPNGVRLRMPLGRDIREMNESIRYWLYPFPTDTRKSFYTLSGLVTDQMGGNIRSGDAFIFINRHCTSMKVLHMETGGLVIYHLRLEEGTFRLPHFEEESHSCLSSWKNLMLMIQFWTNAIVCTKRTSD